MKKTFLAILCLLAACTGAPDQHEVRGAQAAPDSTTADRDQQIFAATMARARQERLDTLPIGEVVARVGSWFVGAPYTPGTLDAPGSESLVVNLREFDCVTYVESMLALARVIRSGQSSYADFLEQLRTIRYRAGRLDGYLARLHYFSEWISDNESKGIVRNYTRALGGILDAEPISFMTRNRAAYRQLADSTLYHAVRAHEALLSSHSRYMIPENRIAAVGTQIQNGDVIAATSNMPGLDVAHTGLALWRDGRLHLMHAPLVGDSVEISQKPLAERIMLIRQQDGIMVARPLEPPGVEG